MRFWDNIIIEKKKRFVERSLDRQEAVITERRTDEWIGKVIWSGRFAPKTNIRNQSNDQTERLFLWICHTHDLKGQLNPSGREDIAEEC